MTERRENNMPLSKSIEDLIHILKQRLSHHWTYRISPEGEYVTLKWEFDDFQQRKPDPARFEPKFDSEAMTLEFSDMAVTGPGGQGSLARAWGLVLPKDYRKFCDTFDEYILATRIPVSILSAEAIEETTRLLRGGWGIPAEQEHRIFPFAEIVGASDLFALRWNADLSQVDVVLAEDLGSVWEPVLTGEDGDSYVTDPDFTAWLERMIRTDGCPLKPGRRESTSRWIKRV